MFLGTRRIEFWHSHQTFFDTWAKIFCGISKIFSKNLNFLIKDRFLSKCSSVLTTHRNNSAQAHEMVQKNYLSPEDLVFSSNFSFEVVEKSFGNATNEGVRKAEIFSLSVRKGSEKIW